MEICSLSEEERKAIELLKEMRNGILELASKNLDNEDVLNGTFGIKKDKIYLFDVLLNLINKQEKAIDRIKEYIQQEIVSREEDIEDYLDDDKEKNKDYIGELKEEKQHWKDIERIIEGKNNEELYMNWWKYGLYE